MENSVKVSLETTKIVKECMLNGLKCNIKTIYHKYMYMKRCCFQVFFDTQVYFLVRDCYLFKFLFKFPIVYGDGLLNK